MKDVEISSLVINNIKKAADIDILNLKGLELAKAVYNMYVLFMININDNSYFEHKMFLKIDKLPEDKKIKYPKKMTGVQDVCISIINVINYVIILVD